MLESLEGKAGIVRYKPPLPAIEGLFGKPTVVNNVVTLASVPNIINLGGESTPVSASIDQQAHSLSSWRATSNAAASSRKPSASPARTDRRLGRRHGQRPPVKAVQVGGPLGAYLPAEQLDTPLDYEAFIEIGAMIGHGGIVVFDDTADMAQQARFAMEFCAIESCGKCTPCRIGSTRGVEVIDRMIAAKSVTKTTICWSNCATRWKTRRYVQWAE